MNIGKVAEITLVSTDTLRYYEREGLLDAAVRAPNGYRSYNDADVSRIKFIRSAQSLGFTLAEIRAMIPCLAKGKMDRSAIEGRLREKMGEIDAHMRRLRALKRELQTTIDSLQCSPGKPVSVEGATRRTVAARKSVRKEILRRAA
jgi:MerR family transcriptional regulator, copper efflux regulator